MEYIGHFKYLGVVIDNNLVFHKHVDSLCKKIACFNVLTYQARKVFFSKTFPEISKCFAEPNISYGLLAYGCSTKKKCSAKNFIAKTDIRNYIFKKSKW